MFQARSVSALAPKAEISKIALTPILSRFLRESDSPVIAAKS